MKEDQKGIYYITGESKMSIINSPFLEKLKKNDLEVLYMVDPLDEYLTQQLKEYSDKKLICITKENLGLDSLDKSLEDLQKKDFEKTCSYMKDIIGNGIEKVVISSRLESSPCVLVTNEYGMTANMQRIMKAQALRANDMGHMMNKKILEINPNNSIIKRIKEKVDSDNSEKRTLNDLIHLLYDVTLQSSGFTLDDPSTFSNRILKLISYGLGKEEEEEEDEKEEKEEKEKEEEKEKDTDNSYDSSSMEQVD